MKVKEDQGEIDKAVKWAAKICESRHPYGVVFDLSQIVLGVTGALASVSAVNFSGGGIGVLGFLTVVVLLTLRRGLRNAIMKAEESAFLQVYFLEKMANRPLDLQ